MIPEVMDIIVKALSKEREKTREVIEAIIDAEGFLFTNDTNYKENRSDIVTAEDGQGRGGPGGPGGPGGRDDMGRSASMVN